MNSNDPQAEEIRLQSLVKGARPSAELPPGFQNRVWQRIDRLERPVPGLVDLLASWWLRPRIALTTLALAAVMAVGLGAARGSRMGDETARHRYLVKVDPNLSPR